MSGFTEAIILAAGCGRRLSDVTDGLPKCLVPVAGRHILERQLEAFLAVGIEHIVVVTGYEADTVEAAARQAAPGARFTFVRNADYDRTNVLTSWLLGSRALSASHVYAHGDTVFAPELLDRLLAGPDTPVTLTVDRHECGEEEMKVRLEGDRIVEISKTMTPHEALGEFTGVMGVRSEVLPRLRAVGEGLLRGAEGHTMFVEAILQALIDRGESDVISVADVTGVAWREIDFPEDLQAAVRLFGDGDDGESE